MGSLHEFPTSAGAQTRLLEQWIKDSIAAHPNSQVAELWSEMAMETLARFPGPPLPSQSHLNLHTSLELTDEHKGQLLESTRQWMESYFSDVHAQLILMHTELLKLQCRVAESEIEYKSGEG